MGCCNNDKCSEKESATQRKIPWFSLIIGLLGVLVIFNWQ